MNVGLPTGASAERAAIFGWISLAVFGLAFLPTMSWLWYRWTLSIWYSGHGVFMPFILAYLLWFELRDDKVQGGQSSPLGFLFLVPGLAMLALDSAIGTDLLAAAGLIVCLPGLSLLLLGLERTRRLIFPLIIAVFMLPIPASFVSQLHLLLREITAYGVLYVMPLLGISISKAGTLVFVPGHTISVADACSGFSTLYAAVTTGLILSHLSAQRSKGLVLVPASIVLAVLCNIVRVSILVLLVYFGSADLLDTWLHEASGLASFAVVVAILFAMAGRETFRGSTE